MTVGNLITIIGICLWLAWSYYSIKRTFIYKEKIGKSTEGEIVCMLWWVLNIVVPTVVILIWGLGEIVDVIIHNWNKVL